MEPITRRYTAHTISGEFSLAASTRRLTVLLCVASLVGLVAVATGGGSLGQLQPRPKRNAFQLCRMVTQHTGQWCLNYVNYGCYCGLGTTATVAPVDEVDNCCRLHDACYGRLSNWCSWWVPIVAVTYSWTGNGDNCTCTDSPATNPCKYNTCLCDLRLARCLQNSTYNVQFYHVNRTACHDS